MHPYLDDGDVRLYLGDARETLAELPAESVHMCVTSPPFFGLRDYGTGAWEGGEEDCDHTMPSRVDAAKATATSRLNGSTDSQGHLQEASYRDLCGKCGARRVDRQIGLEQSPDAWAATLVDVFREVRRVLRKDGTLWVEVGDNYAGSWGAQGRENGSGADGLSAKQIVAHPKATRTGAIPPGAYYKPKDLIGAPWLLAFALRADGWYLRSCIVWHKPNAMPESVTDRPTSSHSYVFLFSKAPRYFYDAEAIREPAAWERWGDQTVPKHEGTETASGWIQPNGKAELESRSGKNARSVWTIPTEPNGLAVCRVCDAYWEGGAPRAHCGQQVVQHFAAFPKELARRCILAGSPDGGLVLDPFAGSGTALLVARQLGRHALGVELNEHYAKMTRARLSQLSLLADSYEPREPIPRARGLTGGAYSPPGQTPHSNARKP